MTLADIPKQCPNIDSCEWKITERKYRNLCRKKSWTMCRHAKKYADKYKFTPKEWKIREVTDEL